MLHVRVVCCHQKILKSIKLALFFTLFQIKRKANILTNLHIHAYLAAS